MPRFDLEHIFTYHSAETEEQIDQYQKIRDAAKEFALVILENTPPGADASTCVRKIRETVMTANAAIALDGRLFEEKRQILSNKGGE